MCILLRPPVSVITHVASRHPPSRSPKVEAKVVIVPSSRSLDRQKLSIDLESASTSSSTASTALQCQHFQSCSGCSQEWELDRPHMAAVAREFFQELGVSDFNFESGMLGKWRCRAKLAVQGTSGRPIIGLYEEGTHNVVDIPLCKAHHPSINIAANLLKQGALALRIQPYDEDLGTGELRYVQAFNSLLKKLHKYVPYGSSVVDLYSGAGVIGLSVASTRKCRSLRCVEINKESKLSFEKSLSRLSKHIDCDIHWHNTDASIEPLHWLKGSNVVIVDPPKKGLGQSLLDALREISNYKDSNVPKSSIIKEKEERRPWMLRARESTVHMEGKTNINWEKAQIWPEFLIYVSCGWESFKKDCLYLLSNNAWHLENAHAFNFFPGTESLEILAVFKRGPGVSQKKKKSGKKKPQIFKP